MSREPSPNNQRSGRRPASAGHLFGLAVKVNGSKFEKDMAKRSLKTVLAGGPFNHRLLSQRADRELHVLTVDFPRPIGFDLVTAVPPGASLRYARMQGKNPRWFPLVEAPRPRSNSFTMLLAKLPAKGDSPAVFRTISAFVGEDNPPSPTDVNVRDDFELLRASTDFWASHAFVVPDAFRYTPMLPDTEQDRCPWL